MKKLLIFNIILLYPTLLFSQDISNIDRTIKLIIGKILEVEEVNKAFQSFQNKSEENVFYVAKVPVLFENKFEKESLSIDNMTINYWPMTYFMCCKYYLQVKNCTISEKWIWIEFRTYSSENFEKNGAKYVRGWIWFEKRVEDWDIKRKFIEQVSHKELYPCAILGFSYPGKKNRLSI